MKFGIRKDVVVMKTNINGKVLSSRIEFRVYRKLFFGLIKMYLKIVPLNGWLLSYEVMVEYTDKFGASCFESREDAELLIQKLACCKDKFVRYKNT